MNLGVQFRASSSGYITGVRFYKELRQHRHAYREPVDLGRDAAGDRHVQQRDRRRAGRSWTSPARWRSPRGRRTWPRITPVPGTTRSPRSGLASAVTNGPLTALAGGGVYAYGSANTFPANTYQRDQLLG